MKKRRLVVGLSVTAGVLAALGVVALPVSQITSAPREVHTAGATAITNVRVERGDQPLTFVFRQLSPSLSLADTRCQAWHDRRTDPCPDAIALAGQFWPGMDDSPNTLFVALPNSCTGYTTGPNFFNVEYLSSNRTLAFHCYTTAAWLNFPSLQLPGTRVQASTPLALVPTERIGPGTVTVLQDDRVEHLIGDEISGRVQLGTVTIS